VYKVFLTDFKAERIVERETKEEDATFVIAQSKPEPLVANPIAKLGGFTVTSQPL